MGMGLGGLGRLGRLGRPAPGKGVGYHFADTDARAYVAAMAVQPDNARKALIDTLFQGLKASGAYAKRDVYVLHAAHDAQAAVLNLKNPATFAASLVNAPVFTIDQGFATDGATSEIDTNYNPTTAGGLFTQNSANWAVWSRTAGQQASGTGWFDGTDGIIINPRNTSNLIIPTINDAGPADSAANTDGAGWFSVNRNAASGVGSKRVSRNGAEVASFNRASAALNNFTLRVGRGATAGYSARQWAAYAIGGSLTTGEEASEYAVLLAYMQAIGAAL